MFKDQERQSKLAWVSLNSNFMKALIKVAPIEWRRIKETFQHSKYNLTAKLILAGLIFFQICADEDFITMKECFSDENFFSAAQQYVILKYENQTSFFISSKTNKN